MFAARASTLARSLSRQGVPTSSSSAAAAAAGRATTNATSNSMGARRKMGGGAHWMEVSPVHTYAGEICGFFAWIWIFHRAKEDLGVVLGFRHPWEHAPDPWAIVDHVEDLEVLENDWDDFVAKAVRPGEDDDDDDDEDDEEEEEEEGDDDDDDE
mmetsp:Transcript_42415/g.77500  ORF Transcript_42415/g.77500 Transcript_42415/m.77500 type:complete len:155 (-) Transcript_42415:153-617(-)